MNKPTIIFVKGPKDPASDRSGRQHDRRPLQRRHRQSHSERNQMKISDSVKSVVNIPHTSSLSLLSP